MSQASKSLLRAYSPPLHTSLSMRPDMGALGFREEDTGFYEELPTLNSTQSV